MKNYSIKELNGRALLCNIGESTLIPYRLERDDATNILYMCEVEGNGKSRITLKVLKELVENGALLSKQGEDPIEFMRKTLNSIEDKNRQLKLELEEEPTEEETKDEDIDMDELIEETIKELETKEEPTPEPTSTEVEPTISNSLIISKGINEKLGNPTLEIKFDKFVSRTLFKLMFDTVREMYPSASYFALKKCVCIQDKGGDKHIDLDVAMEKIKGIKLA